MDSKEIENKINELKRDLLKIGHMRPGSLSEQYNVCGSKKCKCKDPVNPKKHGPYYKLSFVHQGKGNTKFIRKPFLKKVEKEIGEYKKFKELTGRWITLALELSDQEIKFKNEEKGKD